MAKQKFTSAGTDRKQVPGIFKMLCDQLKSPQRALANIYGAECLDYGGGASDKLTKKFAAFGVRNLVLDPFNRSAEHNRLVRQLLRTKPAAFAICSNVLNVIREPAHRAAALQEIADLTAERGLVFFTVHEGNRTSRGRRTGPDQWQCNRPLKSYSPEIRKVFAEINSFAGGRALVACGHRKPRGGLK